MTNKVQSCRQFKTQLRIIEEISPGQFSARKSVVFDIIVVFVIDAVVVVVAVIVVVVVNH